MLVDTVMIMVLVKDAVTNVVAVANARTVVVTTAKLGVLIVLAGGYVAEVDAIELVVLVLQQATIGTG